LLFIHLISGSENASPGVNRIIGVTTTPRIKAVALPSMPSCSDRQWGVVVVLKISVEGVKAVTLDSLSLGMATVERYTLR